MIGATLRLVGLSFDKVCLLLNFFQNLKLRKSQADALLSQLSRRWECEFDTLCTLLANSAVVHADETSWSRPTLCVGARSVWAFLSEKVRLLFFGVHKDAETLRQILDPETFEGIELTLLEPTNQEYRHFTDRLLEIYRAACRVQCDRRLGEPGRARKVAELDDEILYLCGPMWCAELPPLEGPDDDYRLLYQRSARTTWSAALEKLSETLELESLPLTHRPRHSLDVRAMQRHLSPRQHITEECRRHHQ